MWVWGRLVEARELCSQGISARTKRRALKKPLASVKGKGLSGIWWAVSDLNARPIG